MAFIPACRISPNRCAAIQHWNTVQWQLSETGKRPYETYQMLLLFIYQDYSIQDMHASLFSGLWVSITVGYNEMPDWCTWPCYYSSVLLLLCILLCWCVQARHWHFCCFTHRPLIYQHTPCCVVRQLTCLAVGLQSGSRISTSRLFCLVCSSFVSTVMHVFQGLACFSSFFFSSFPSFVYNNLLVFLQWPTGNVWYGTPFWYSID